MDCSRILSILSEKHYEISIVTDGLLWDPKVVLRKLKTVCSTVTSLTEILLDWPLLLEHDVIKDHDAAFFFV